LKNLDCFHTLAKPESQNSSNAWKPTKSAAQNALNACTLIFHRAFLRRCFSKLKVGKLRHKPLKVEDERFAYLQQLQTPGEKAPPSRRFTLEDTDARGRTPLNRMTVLFPVAAASRQVLIIEFGVFCCRFFLYHEALSTLLLKGIKAFAFVGKVAAWAKCRSSIKLPLFSEMLSEPLWSHKLEAALSSGTNRSPCTSYRPTSRWS